MSFSNRRYRRALVLASLRNPTGLRRAWWLRQDHARRALRRLCRTDRAA